jgi:hypothetical protein
MNNPIECEGLKPCRCPGCGEKIDAATAVSPDVPDGYRPSVGDFTVCLYCASALVFEKTRGSTLLSLRPATIADINALDSSSKRDISRATEAILAARARRRRN